MATTLNELKDYLKTLDELTLLELLELTSIELVDNYSDLIEEKQEKLMEDFEIDNATD